MDPNGKISLKPAGDAPSKPAPAARTAPVVDSADDAPEADSDGSDSDGSDSDGSDSDGSDDGVSDDADYDDDDDYEDDAPAADSDNPIQANFEDAFKAELETVHGDLGNAASGNRGGGGGGGGGDRRRRSR